MLTKYLRCLAFLILVPLVWSVPLNHDMNHSPLAAVSDLNSRLATRASLLQSDLDPRLPLPSVQDLETVKKVAQILITLGEQVLPSVFGERPSKPPSSTCAPTASIPLPTDVPNDAVQDK